MRVYLETLGCRLNYAEMATLGRQLVGAGHDLVASATDADVCVLNSCAVTAEATRKSRQLARHLARVNPTAHLVVTGCYATLEADAVAQLPNVTLVVGNARKDDLLELLAEQEGEDVGEPQAKGIQSSGLPLPASGFELPASGPDRTRAFIKVQDGCHNRCTFCIVTVARGEERSRSLEDVVDEINALHAAGYQEAILTGVHLGAYGRDLGGDLRSLVAALLSATTIPRLRMSSLEPFDIAPDFFDLWTAGAGRLMPHLHLPAQSGSDATLRRMARRNRVADFEALVARARERIPGLTITTDLIVGFPGESDEDFAQTIDFADRNGFAHLHVFPYSPRDGTAAARMSGQIPEIERRRRSRVLNELDAKLRRSARAQFIGQERPVLWEAVEPHAPVVDGLVTWSGLTDNYLRVVGAVPAGLNLHNRITPTRLIALEGDDLRGEVQLVD